jgi:SAM-dependent methyltransferase
MASESPQQARTEDGKHWTAFQRAFFLMRPPLRPDADVVAAFRELTRGCAEPMLLLGVTPELADLSEDLTALDRTQDMIDAVWPGDTAQRRARVGNWLKLRLPAASFASVVCDGGALAFPYPGLPTKLLREVAHVLIPGGRFVTRVYSAPDEGETLAAVRGACERGEVGSMHALKWRVAMAIVHERGAPNVPVTEIRDTIERWFPDREALSAKTGWPREEIDTIDSYAGSNATYGFATRRQILDIVPPDFTNARFVEAGSYELAERCPLLVLERA